MEPAGFEPQRAWTASGVRVFDPAATGWSQRDSNPSEPGRRAVSRVRSRRDWMEPAGFEPQRAWTASGVAGSIPRRLDGASGIRTPASLDGERGRGVDPAAAGWS